MTMICFIVGFFQSIQDDAAWIGLQFTVEDNSAKVKYSWTDGWPVTYTHWDVSQPSGEVLQDLNGCTKINKNGNWEIVSENSEKTSCTNKLPYICKKNMGEIPEPSAGIDEKGTCDNDWEYADGSSCYYIEYGTRTSETKTWIEALSSCRKRGGDLASFHSPDQIETLTTQFKDKSSHNLFIGLASDGFQGWTWSDKTPYDFSNWGENEPNQQFSEECVEIYPWNGKWNDIDCSEKRGFICKRPKEYSQCSISLSKREDCGFSGIDEDYCVESRRCCWDPTYIGGNVSGCFYPKSGGIAPVPSNNDDTTLGLSGGAIFGIILAVVVMLILLFAVYKYTCSEKSKSFSDFTTSFNNKTKNNSSKYESSKGFDNPNTISDSNA